MYPIILAVVVVIAANMLAALAFSKE